VLAEMGGFGELNAGGAFERFRVAAIRRRLHVRPMDAGATARIGWNARWNDMCMDMAGPTGHCEFLSRPDWRLPQPEPDFGLIFHGRRPFVEGVPLVLFDPDTQKSATSIAVSIAPPRTFVAMADHGTSRRSRNRSVEAFVETKAAAHTMDRPVAAATCSGLPPGRSYFR
jgi:hypothetical protein